MMTSAPSYTAASAGLPSPALSDTAADCTDPAQLSLRLVKRPLVGQPLDACKKRRKQSTPIRISTSDPPTTIDEAEGDGDGDGDASSGAGAISSGGVHFLPPSPVPQNCSPVGGSTPTLILDYASREHTEKFTAGLSGQEPTDISKNSMNMTGAVDVRTSTGALLPAWMSDSTGTVQGPKAGEQADWLPLQGMAIAGTASLYLSHLPQSELQAQSRNANQPSIRIFNPEAYCELCNKEFCNKYFLKTHKANKHRIYSDPPVSEMLMNIPNFSAPVSTQIKKNVLLNIDVTKTNMDVTKTTGSYQCEICGKGFSYKLLLKNHKKSIHGIACDTDSSTELEMEQSERHMIKVEDPEPGQINTEPPEDENLSKTNAFFKNGLPMEMPQVKEETYLEQEDSSFIVTSICKTSPTPTGSQSRESAEQSVNRLRRMGIMNPEAFCEICCKEYCNKYFLRTHKMKRHGILIPDDPIKDNQKPDQSPIANSWYQIQTSPLNLIMGEQNTNSSGSYGERKSSPTNENECDLCGMRFQTSYLAQLHSVNCKAKSMTDPSDPGIKLENSNISNVTNNNEKYSVTSSADAISEDLQKLQSMILQLNNLGENKTGNGGTGVTCSMCNKELENRYFLQAHMMAEHNIFPDDNLEEKRERENDPSVNTSDSITCKFCGRDGFTSADSFKQHMLDCHSPIVGDIKEDSNDPVNTEGKTPNAERRFSSQVPVERRSSISLTPTSSYCEICNKELCNKYFMKTHMQRMHGIEIENGAQIGGVVCNICNKELCSKYFLRVHKHNTHGIVEEGSGSTSGQVRQITSDIESGTAPAQQPIHPSETTDNALKPDLADLSHRYFSHFSEVCSICNRRFRSTKWLKAHLLGDHGKSGTEKWNEIEMQLQQSFGQQARTTGFNKGTFPERTTSPMLKIPNGGGANATDKVSGVQNVLSSLFGTDESNVKQYFCSYCPFSTPVLAFLFVHERSHSRPEQEGESGGFQCAVCNQSFRQPELLQHHVLSQHPFLPMSSLFSNVLQQSPPTPTTSTSQSKPLVSVPKSPELGTGAAPGPAPAPASATASTNQTGTPERTNTEAGEHRCSKCSHCKGGCEKQPGTTAAPDIGLSLKDVSKQSNLPATYALPQTVAATKYIMQAFLMDEPGGSGPDVQAIATGGDRKFAPSIVFLPVLERLSAPLTVSFTLTPT